MLIDGGSKREEPVVSAFTPKIFTRLGLSIQQPLNTTLMSESFEAMLRLEIKAPATALMQRQIVFTLRKDCCRFVIVLLASISDFTSGFFISV